MRSYVSFKDTTVSLKWIRSPASTEKFGSRGDFHKVFGNNLHVTILLSAPVLLSHWAVIYEAQHSYSDPSATDKNKASRGHRETSPVNKRRIKQNETT